MYALGRNLQYYDEPAVRAIVRHERREQLHARRRSCLGVVRSAPFLMRSKSDTGRRNRLQFTPLALPSKLAG